MISQTFRIARMIVLASFALSSAAWAATCSKASLSGTYGLLHGGTDAAGQPTIGVSQLTFDSTTGTYIGEDTASHNGVITTIPITATYAVASNCIGRATVTIGGRSENIHFVVTSTGFLNINQTTGVTAEGFAVKQGSPTCTNAGVVGSFGFEATGVFVAGGASCLSVFTVGAAQVSLVH